MRKIITLLFSLIMVAVFSVTVLAEPVPEIESTPSESSTSSESTTSSEVATSSESATSSENITSSDSTTSSDSATSSESAASSENATSSGSATSSENATSSDSATSSESASSSGSVTSSNSTISSGNSTSSQKPTSSESATSSVNSSSQPTEEKIESKLQVVELPKKTVYEIGETLDLTGLKVNIISDAGVVISNNGQNLTIASTVFKAEGEQKIEVKYKDLTTHFYVTVGPKHTHKYGAWSIKIEATCEQDGQKVRECECGEKETLVVNKLDHNWDAGEIVKKSTTKSEGEMKYTCTRCEQQKSEKIPKLSEEVVETQTQTNEEFKLTLKWWMIFVPVALIIAGYICAITVIFKKKA